MKNENGRSPAAEKQNTKMEVTAPIEVNSGLIGSPPPITLANLKDLDIKSIGKVILTLVLGLLGLTAILMVGFIIVIKMLLEHPLVTSGIIFIVILSMVRNLSKDKIKALTELIQSLPTRLFPKD